MSAVPSHHVHLIVSNVHVLAGLEDVFFSPRDQTVSEGEGVFFQCVSGESSPPASITWLKDGTLVSRGRHIQVSCDRLWAHALCQIVIKTTHVYWIEEDVLEQLKYWYNLWVRSNACKMYFLSANHESYHRTGSPGQQVNVYFFSLAFGLFQKHKLSETFCSAR